MKTGTKRARLQNGNRKSPIPVDIDGTGRLMLPKFVPQALGISGRTELEIEIVGGHAQLSPTAPLPGPTESPASGDTGYADERFFGRFSARQKSSSKNAASENPFPAPNRTITNFSEGTT